MSATLHEETIDDLAAASRPPGRLVDVRSPGEFRAQHVPGSLNVPLALLREHRDRLRVTHSDPVVLVCASGARAEQARSLLDDRGFAGLEVLPGGISAWIRRGGEVTRGRGVWAMERQVRLTAGTLVLSGVLAGVRWPPAAVLAGAIGAGLTFSALTDTCGMARVLAMLPHNRDGSPDPEQALAALAH